MLVMETEKLADTFMVLMSQFLFLKASWIKRVYHLNGAGVIHKNQRASVNVIHKELAANWLYDYQYLSVLSGLSQYLQDSKLPLCCPVLRDPPGRTWHLWPPSERPEAAL